MYRNSFGQVTVYILNIHLFFPGGYDSQHCTPSESEIQLLTSFERKMKLPVREKVKELVPGNKKVKNDAKLLEFLKVCDVLTQKTNLQMQN